MPELTGLDEATKTIVAAAVGRLRESVDAWSDDFLRLARENVPGYDMLDDDDIRGSARRIVEGEIAELESLRIPDDALREQLEGFALRRVAQGISIDTLSLSYHLGSRQLLVLMDEIAAEVGLPNDLLLSIHDSTWEFAAEAAAVFARVARGLAVERARFDAERRSAFARGVLGGGMTADQIARDAGLFGLDHRRSYRAVATRPAPSAEADELRGTVAVTLGVRTDRLLFAELDSALGCIAPGVLGALDSAPTSPAALVAVGSPLPLDRLGSSFEEAVLALEAAERFGLTGLVTLSDLGPKPLVLGAERPAELLAARHLGALAGEGRAGVEVGETVRVYLACDQNARDAARLLTVHPNTVRYRVSRFRESTGLDVRRTEDLVTAWWLLNRQPRPAPAPPVG